MRRAIQQLLIVWLALSLLCAGVILSSRLGHGPGPLQALGISLCDAEPCYHGLSLGMDWYQLQDSHPEAIRNDAYLELPSEREQLDSRRLLPVALSQFREGYLGLYAGGKRNAASVQRR
jgi:hypothetical protein